MCWSGGVAERRPRSDDRGEGVHGPLDGRQVGDAGIGQCATIRAEPGRPRTATSADRHAVPLGRSRFEVLAVVGQAGLDHHGHVADVGRSDRPDGRAKTSVSSRKGTSSGLAGCRRASRSPASRARAASAIPAIARRAARPRGRPPMTPAAPDTETTATAAESWASRPGRNARDRQRVGERPDCRHLARADLGEDRAGGVGGADQPAGVTGGRRRHRRPCSPP